jgi:hypothetical protein
MKCELTWRIKAETSALHAASVVSSGQPTTDLPQRDALRKLVEEADTLARVAGIPPRLLWETACATSLDAEGADDLAEYVNRKLFGRESHVSPEKISLHLRPVLQWGRRAFPNLDQTLRVRQNPLKTQWQARGPGLLHFVGKLTKADVIPPAATVALVQPVVGGHGAAHLDSNAIRFEAMLVNPLPELPEVVRMAWLISQLQIDIPANSESLNKQRLPWLAALALLPAALSAGEFVELVHVDHGIMQTAIGSWILPSFPDKQVAASNLSGTVWQWWNTYQQGRPPWPVALAALDRMLPA